jgi:hypothetical protein
MDRQDQRGHHFAVASLDRYVALSAQLLRRLDLRPEASVRALL